jgi:NADPH:quinone reductase-like Zn-dependent oxidoreductase
LIRVGAAGVGAWDPYEREGRFVEITGIEPTFPYVLGTDGAGTIEAVGKNVTHFKEGDRVYAAELGNPKGGFYAQYAAVKADNVSRIPGNLTIEQAAVLPTDAITALTGLENVLGLQPGESLMVFGASGGIGHLALQLAKRLGCKVFAIASGDDGVQFAKQLGADVAVDGRSDDVLSAARAFAPNGIDAALVTAGGEKTNQALSAIRKGGRIAYPHGVMPEPVAPDGVSIEAYDGEASRALIDQLNTLINSGPFTVQVDRTFRLEDAAEAHKSLAEHHLGKIALRIE